MIIINNANFQAYEEVISLDNARTEEKKYEGNHLLSFINQPISKHYY